MTRPAHSRLRSCCDVSRRGSSRIVQNSSVVSGLLRKVKFSAINLREIELIDWRDNMSLQWESALVVHVRTTTGNWGDIAGESYKFLREQL